ncbi:TPA: helix-turn-helix transcriptional regulator [Enterococcus faecium]|mgnify:FL=1|uniref:helix-turn-helix domain-containing protein n=1 Tax=Enterococcus faecium TaxID=1352 RepID=UPI00093C0E0A|nr:helix-turn-helix transcriptional regulator [Enterococcus faecium]MCU1821363.1 helix-turn-helix domain-containing protein [Enterococcus faecium]MDW7937378.1 helix-turn-helix transcriptional regulator [Enterococcus faecium]MUN70640.1 XRE family transcriptional regulator [Enterococcus faecium]PHL10461.1 XRE family transcriptional regulator [Enterococcus faecium]PHL18356.1 XRE family transcriptional regulator [Enterococcus faecium]
MGKQNNFAKFLGIPFRTYQNYECGHRYPKNMEVINKVTVALNVTVEDLLGPSGGYIVESEKKGISRHQHRMAQMVTQLSAMFAGGEIDQESKDAMVALNDVYWKHKTENRQRFTPKKYRSDETSSEG